MNKKAINKYLCKALKNCPLSFKKTLKLVLYTDLYEFLTTHPDTNEEELVFNFGKPELFCSNYIAALDDSERVKLLSKNNFIKRVIAIFVAIILMLIAVGVAIIVVDSLNSSVHYYGEEIDG